MHRLSRALAALTLALSLGCTGTVSNGDRGGAPGDVPEGGNAKPGVKPPSGAVVPPAPAGMQPTAPATVSAGVAPMRRLTRAQYRNTVRDLLGVADVVSPSALPGDDAIADRFHSNTVSPLQAIDVGRYADAADTIAKAAVANLATLVPCDLKVKGEAACARTFIEGFGKRAYRRPLTPAEVELLQGVYALGGDFASGIRLVIAGLLQSPKFLYLPEPVPMAAAGKIVGVDGWALASRLSYFLLDTMPDDELFLAAEKGHLGTPAEVGDQATRLMNDARFRATLFTFHQEWLQLDTLPGTEKDAQLFPVWTPALRDALGEETRRFVEYVFGEGDRRLDTLLSAPFSFVNGPLATLYGMTAGAPAAGTWQRLDLPKDQRAGLLTQGSLMATLAHDNRTSFILRGKMVREALLCATPLMPPADVPAEPKLDPQASAKARSEAHRKDPACASCHELFDPMGFAFEIYDAVGRYRTSDGAGPIDARVQLTHTKGLDGKTAANAVELARLLAGADEVRDCVARQWMRFGLGRDDAAEDEPSLAGAIKAFKDGGAKLPALLVSIARSDAFRYQKVEQ
jgi:hypothetical protein